MKTGPAWKVNVVGAGAQDGGAENVGGHQVRRGLHALEAEAEQPAEGLDDERLGDAGHAFKQRVALAEHGDQDFFDGLCLAGNHAAELAGERAR